MNEKPIAEAHLNGQHPPGYRVPALFATCVILLLLIFFFDLSVPLGVAAGVLYAIVILFALWLPRNNAALGFALISTVLIITVFFLKQPVEEMWKAVLNRSIAFFTVWTVAWLGLKRKSLEQQRAAILVEREMALRELKILRGLLPICASCKRIKSEEGNWTQIEGFITKHSEAEFTHGICPDCAERLYPDVFKKSDLHKEK